MSEQNSEPIFISSKELRRRNLFGKMKDNSEQDPEIIEYFGTSWVDSLLMRRGKQKPTRAEREAYTKNLWKFKARISRRKYWIQITVYGLISTPLFLFLMWWTNNIYNRDQLNQSNNWKFLLLQGIFFFFVLTIVHTVQRMHDVNRSPWWLLVPGYNIYLLSKPSAPPNKYGDGPYL